MSYSTTPEMKAARNTLAPLLAAGLIEPQQYRDYVDLEIQINTLNRWKSRELKKKPEDRERRLVIARRRIAHKKELSVSVPAKIASIEILPAQQNIESIQPANEFLSVRDSGLRAICSELDQAQLRTAAKLRDELNLADAVESKLSQSLKDDITPRDIKVIVESLAILSETRRKIALMPYGAFNVDKQIPSQSMHLHGALDSTGLKGYNPKKLNNPE